MQVDAGEESIFGVGRDAFEEFYFLQDASGAFGHGAHRIFSEMHWQAGFSGDKPVNAADQRTAAGHDQAAINEIGGEFGRATFEGDADGLQNT